MSNQGEVTNISQLPITNIKYGPLRFELESVKVVVGPIVCQPSENALSIREQILANQIEELKDFTKVIENENKNLKTIITENFEIVTNQIQNNYNKIKASSCPGDGTCSNHGTCDISNGNCVCNSGFQGDMCQGKLFL